VIGCPWHPRILIGCQEFYHSSDENKKKIVLKVIPMIESGVVATLLFFYN